VYQLLGLARRAGALAHGTAAVRDSIRAGEAKLVLLAGDASTVQLNKVFRTMESRSIPRVRLGDRATLGAALGLAPISSVAVTSTSLADRLLAELGDAELGRGAVAAAVEAAQD
jgi:ribosomal protein L7Ae-like RNA K-turn-binding protein